MSGFDTQSKTLKGNSDAINQMERCHMKMVYAYFKTKYNTWDTFELESKPGKEAGKIRRVLAWFFISTGFAILFGSKGWNLSINGRKQGENV